MKKGYFLVFLTAIISGFSIFINKYGVGLFINPYLFTFLKNFFVSVFLLSFFFLFKDWKKLKFLTKRDWVFLVLIGLIGGSIPFLLFFKGLSLTSAAKGSFLHKTMFIYCSILATLFLKEKIDKKFLFAALILLFANAILLKKIPSEFNKGDLLVFLATIFWAIENTISKYLLKNLEGREVALARMFFGSIFILIYLTFTNQISPISTLNLKQIAWVLITGILLFGYVITWYSGLKHIPLHQATAILLLGSPITTFLNLISGAKISQIEMISGSLIIFGILIIFWKKFLEIILKLKNLIYVRT